VLLDEDRGLGFADPATSNTQHKTFDFLRVGVEPARVQTEKSQKDHEPNALVPVYKGVISQDVKEMGRCHLRGAFVQEPPFKGGGGSS
jgi:hypothetical protein